MWKSATQRNISVVRRFFDEQWNAGGNPAGLDALIGPNHQHHFPSGSTLNRDGLRQFLADFLTAFPDVQTTIEDIFAAQDKVAVRFTIRGTHQGEGMGLQPTGKRVSYTGIDIFRVVDGRIVKRWGEVDTYGMLRQLGVIPDDE